MDILERITAYDCSDGRHSDAAEGSAYDLLADAKSEIEALRSTLNYRIPCDVTLPPRTIIRKGCTLKALIVGLIARENIS